MLLTSTLLTSFVPFRNIVSRLLQRRQRYASSRFAVRNPSRSVVRDKTCKLRDKTASVVREFNYLHDDKLATGINVRNQQVPCTGQSLSFFPSPSLSLSLYLPSMRQSHGLHEILERCLSYRSPADRIICRGRRNQIRYR